MSKYLKLFETTSQYNEYINGSDVVLPNVSVAKDAPTTVYYKPYVPPFFCKLTLNNGSTVELEGSGELTNEIISSYSSTLVSAEIGTLCTSIGNYAFYNCSGLTSITIPDSVTSIVGNAFAYCTSLTNCTIGSGVTSIGDNAFANCTSLPVVDNIRYADTYAVEVVDKTLTTYTIKEGTKCIGRGAFYQCSSLTSIEIPDSVTSIGDEAFYNCKGLTNCTIGSGVTSIGQSAFQNCSSLTSVTIPDSVTSIGNQAFFFCYSLTSVTSLSITPPTLIPEYDEDRGEYNYDHFNINASGRKIYVPSESVAAYKSASGWSTYASDIEAIPSV